MASCSARAVSTCLSSGMICSPFRPQLQAPHSVLSRARGMHTRCSSSNNHNNNNKGSTYTTPAPSLQESTKQGLSQAEQSSERSSLGSIFLFGGAAPETINGRMAMMGFAWALVAEKLTGLTVVEQLFNPSTAGLLWFGVVVQLFAIASIIPFANGQSTDARAWGPFNAKAERWNGRLAMLGFASLLLVEIAQHAPLIHNV